MACCLDEEWNVSDVATTALVSERIVQCYIERFQQIASVSPFEKKNGPDRTLVKMTKLFLYKRYLTSLECA